MKKSAVALYHVAFENLGTLEPVLDEVGFRIEYVDATCEALSSISAADADLLCVLGGPIGAYEEAAYPFIEQELGLLKARLALRRPVLGICLGAQLLARALGAAVYPGPVKEIEWKPIDLTAQGQESCLCELDGVPVLHWHGDTFDLPAGAVHLASTAAISNQAFQVDTFALALQFHAEVRAQKMEQWLVGHACELAVNQVSVTRIREDAYRYGADLEQRAKWMLLRWLSQAGLLESKITGRSAAMTSARI